MWAGHGQFLPLPRRSVLAPDFRFEPFFGRASIQAGMSEGHSPPECLMVSMFVPLLDRALVHSALAAAQEERSVPQTGLFVAHFGRAVAQEPMLQSDMPACIASLSNCGTHAPAGVRAGAECMSAEADGVPDEVKCTADRAKCAADRAGCGYALPVGG